jgi:TolB protein
MKGIFKTTKIIIILLFFNLISNSTFAEKIYIDITQPGIKKLSIALEGFEEISKVGNTIKEELEFTEYFKIYGPFPYRGEKFDPLLWKSADVEIVIRAVSFGKIDVKVYTVTTDVPIFTKDYPLQNNEYTGKIIASDIYRLLTGKNSPFFNQFTFVRKFKNSMGIFISNWNGTQIQDTGIRREIISKVVLKDNKIFYSSLQNKFWHIEVFDIFNKSNREIIKSRNLLKLGDVSNKYEIIYLESDGELSQIKILDLSGKNKTVSSSRWIDASPRFAPYYILLVSNRVGSPQIYQMSYDGLSIRRLTYQGRYNTEPTISPYGDKIAFSSLSAGFQINVLDLNFNMQTQITKDGNNEQPSFCPDGHFLTIMSDRSGKKEILLISSDGAVQKSLTHGYLPHCSR